MVPILTESFVHWNVKPVVTIELLDHLTTAIFLAFEGMGSPEVSHCYTGDNIKLKCQCQLKFTVRLALPTSLNYCLITP
jgi:hypothetical protein